MSKGVLFIAPHLKEDIFSKELVPFLSSIEIPKEPPANPRPPQKNIWQVFSHPSTRQRVKRARNLYREWICPSIENPIERRIERTNLINAAREGFKSMYDAETKLLQKIMPTEEELYAPFINTISHPKTRRASNTSNISSITTLSDTLSQEEEREKEQEPSNWKYLLHSLSDSGFLSSSSSPSHSSSSSYSSSSSSFSSSGESECSLCSMCSMCSMCSECSVNNRKPL